MAKTYTINSSSMNAGRRSSYSTDWAGFQEGSAAGLVTGVSSAGYSSSFYRAVNILFSSSDLAQFSGKTITSIVLRITVNSGTLGSTSYPYRVRYKLNSTTSTAASGDAWTSSDSGQSSAGSYDVATWSNGQSSGSTTITSGSTHDFSVGKTIPKYGYVIAGSTGNAYMTLGSTAQLIVTTNETDYTLKLSYNANGGSGTPATQSATVTASGTPSKTFTVNPNSTAVSKTGSTFIGWSTNSSATTASYSNGSSITISSNTTLYAVFQPYKVTIRYNANGGSMASTHGANFAVNGSGFVTLNGSTDFQFVNYGSSIDPYNYNSPNYINLIKTGYACVSGAEWNTAADGTGTSFNQGTSYAATTYASNVSTGNRTVTLYANWKATTSYISASNGTLGTQMTIGVVRYNSSHTHTITYKYGSETGTIGTGVATSVNWTPPLSLASQFTNATSGTCTLTCETFNGSTSLGKTTTNITLSIPSSVKCTVTGVTLSETVSSVSSKFGAYVQGKSKIKVTGTTSTSNAYGATVSSYSITINGQTLTSNGATTGLISSSGTLTYSFKITDSRGRTDTSTGTFNVLAYTAPSISATIQRNSSTPTSIDIAYSWNISAVNDLNDKQIVIKYRVFGSGSYTTVATLTPAIYAGSSTYTISDTDTDTAYEVVLTLTDYFTSISTSAGVSALGSRIFGISHVDQTIARHGDSPADGWDHQYFKEKFHSNVTVEGTSTFNGTVDFNGVADNGIGDLSTTGTVLNGGNPAAVSVPTGTWTTIATLTLTKGIWLVYATARFASNATGYRRHIIAESDTGTSANAIQSDDTRVAVNGAYTFTRTLNHYTTNGTTFYLRAYQDSGSSLSTTGRMYATKIC